MDTALFRKVSLDRLSSPEQIDHLLEVTTARTWIALIALCCTLTAGIIWSVMGSSDDTVIGRGVITGTGVNAVVALGAGNVIDLHVEVGEVVKAGQVVAQIAQPALEQKLKEAKEQLEEARQARDSALKERAESDAAKLVAIKKQISSTEQEITDTQEQTKWARDQIPVDEELVTKGLITKQTALPTSKRSLRSSPTCKKWERKSRSYSLNESRWKTTPRRPRSITPTRLTACFGTSG